MMSSGYTIDAVVTTAAAARVKNAYGTGKHRVYIGEASPVEYTTPSPSSLTQQQSETLSSADKVKFRNHFDEQVPVGAELILIMGADGIGKIISWPCDE